EHREPARGRVGGHPLGELEHAVGTTVARDEPLVGLEAGLERYRPVEHALDDAAALPAEVERGADAFRGERQALPGRVAYREHAPHRGAERSVREIGAVVGAGRGAVITQEPV